MRKAILFIGILFFCISAKSQNWDPEFVKSLREYYFIPVEFESFGDWITGIENDSSLLFKKRILTQVNDSIYLNFELQKPGLASSFKNSTLSLKVLGNTISDKRVKYESPGKNLVKVIDLPSRKVTALNIYASISFDTTNSGRLLAAQAQKELEDRFVVFFADKRIDKSNKNIHKRKFHRETERSAYFKRKDELISMFRIRTYNLQDSNKVELCLSYELNH
jgi:hypothetical protein